MLIKWIKKNIDFLEVECNFTHHRSRY